MYYQRLESVYTEDCTAAELACICTAAPSDCSKELQRDEVGGYQGVILSEQLTTLGPQFTSLLKTIHSCAKLLILQLMHPITKACEYRSRTSCKVKVNMILSCLNLLACCWEAPTSCSRQLH